jgi:imidazole glycerol-phosphate synthase subunit HisH
MKKKIAIIEYNTGNVSAISNMLSKINEKSVITSDPKIIEDSEIIILPGVGSFDRAIKKLEEKNLIDILKLKISENTKILGICLGMQILTLGSEEGDKEGLKVFDTYCKSFNKQNSKDIFMGWSNTKAKKNEHKFDFLNKSKFYFLHKYYFPYHQDYTIAISENNLEFSSVVRKNNVFGVQFHPEKSHNFGINFFKNFINI